MSEQVALLLTDVVDSTKIGARLGDAAMSALWATHDRIARDLLRDLGGREIDKSDGFLLMFATVDQAVGYAMAYHGALSGLEVPLQARAGIHFGPVEKREATQTDIAHGAKALEVDGIAKPIAARVMSVAAGGQTLMTSRARESLGDSALRVQSHGHWRLKGIEAPVELFQVGHEDELFVQPAESAHSYRVERQGDVWLPRREVGHNIPAERDSFVGRSLPLRSLDRCIEDGARLVSILGAGGTGKTRLAQRFARLRMGDFSGGAWFCDLSQALSLDGLVHAVALGIGVPLGRLDPVVQIGNAISALGPCLIVIDNFEQVARLAEATVGVWMTRASEARFIVTSRELLRVRGEHALALAPLDAAEGERLFLERARATVGGEAITAEDRRAVVPLVRLLDGLPLAIELAAARVPVMSPRTLLVRMSERFTLLTSAGGRPARQSTLRAALDWSWELLSSVEKIALAQLSVFEGGFTLPAAESVLGLAVGGPPTQGLDALQSLVEKSLVRRVGRDRFDLLVSVRHYGLEKLADWPPETPPFENQVRATQSRHFTYFALLAREQGATGAITDLDNFVAGCASATRHGEAERAVACLEGAWAVLSLTGPFRAALDLARRVGAVDTLSQSQRARVEWVAGSAQYAMGRMDEARGTLEDGLVLARAGEDRNSEAKFLCALGEHFTTSGRIDLAPEFLRKALDLCDAVADGALKCRILNALGALASDQSRFQTASEYYAQGLRIAREIGDRRWQGGLLGNLGGLHHGKGQLDRARDLYQQALALADDSGDRRWAANTHCNLGLLHHEQGSVAEAHHQYGLALQMAKELGDPRLECNVLCNLGLSLESQGEGDEALTSYLRAVELAVEVQDVRAEGQFRGYLGLLYARQGAFKESRDCIRKGKKLLQTISDDASLGVLVCHESEARRLAGDADSAKRGLKRAEAIARKLLPAGSAELDTRVARLRTALYEEGRPLVVPRPTTAD